MKARRLVGPPARCAGLSAARLGHRPHSFAVSCLRVWPAEYIGHSNRAVTLLIHTTENFQLRFT